MGQLPSGGIIIAPDAVVGRYCGILMLDLSWLVALNIARPVAQVNRASGNIRLSRPT
jgi:hypothetical protein